jgi:SSS family solute:Na+ symporter
MTAAVLTSVQSGLTAVSAATQVNFIRPRMTRQLTDRESVLLARGLLAVTGVCIICAAIWVRSMGQQNSLIQILNIVMYPFTGVLLGIFLLGMLSHRANGQGVLIGGILGFLGTIAVPAGRVLWPGSEIFQYLGRISNFYYGFVGTMLTLLVGYIASYAFPAPPPSKIKGLTRRSLPLEPQREVAAQEVR